MFSIASFKEASIANNMEHSSGIIQWNIQFIRLIHDWEVEVLASFYRCLYDCKMRGVGVDKLWWVPSKSIWRSKAPPRVAFFAWMAACGKILIVERFLLWMILG